MTPTIGFIQERFDHFNRLCFEGRLPRVPIRLSRARTFLGALTYRRTRKPGGGETVGDFVLKVSTHFDLPVEEVEDTIIHEMIHLYIASNGYRDTSTHGLLFRRKMKSINQRHGRHIAISHKWQKKATGEGGGANEGNGTEAVPPLGQTACLHRRRKSRLVCVVHLREHLTGIVCPARTRVFEFNRQLPLLYSVEAMEWFLTNDPYFDRYPNSIAPKLFKADPDLLGRLLKNATALVCDGKTIRVKHC